jgi:hypothetical protein
MQSEDVITTAQNTVDTSRRQPAGNACSVDHRCIHTRPWVRVRCPGGLLAERLV